MLRQPFRPQLEILEDRVVPTQSANEIVSYVPPSLHAIFPAAVVNYSQYVQNATVQITSGLVPSEDQLFLQYFGPAPITSSYNAATGTLTLTGTATGVEWANVLGFVYYDNIASNPSNGDRVVSAQLGPAIYSSATGHYYEFIGTSTGQNLTWLNARTSAGSRNNLGLTGYLATITSQAEQDFVASMVGGAVVWLGGSDANSANTWRWVTGPEGSQGSGAGLAFHTNNGPVAGSYNNWNASHPVQSSTSNYIAMATNGEWLSVTNGFATEGYVVEYGGFGNTPSFFDRFTSTIHVLDRTPSPTVINPSTSVLTTGSSYTITGTAPAGALVQVFVDANNDGAPDNSTSPVATQQLGNSASFAISTPLTQNVNNFVVRAIAYSGANPSFAVDVPTISVIANKVGTFMVDAPDAVRVSEHFMLSLAWTVPGGGWRELNTVDLRLHDRDGTILWVRFDEAANTLSLFNPHTGKFGTGGTPGSPQLLANAFAIIDLAKCSVKAAGPTSPTVTLTLDVIFGHLAAGRTYKLEIAATDDLGNRQDFAKAGVLHVTRKHPLDWPFGCGTRDIDAHENRLLSHLESAAPRVWDMLAGVSSNARVAAASSKAPEVPTWNSEKKPPSPDIWRRALDDALQGLFGE